MYCQFNCQQLLIAACKAFQAVASVRKAQSSTEGQTRAGGQGQGLNAVPRQSRWAPSESASHQSSGQGRRLLAAAGQGSAGQAGLNAAAQQGRSGKARPNAAGQAETLTGLLESTSKLLMVFSQTGWLTRLEGRVDDQERFADLFKDLQELSELVSLDCQLLVKLILVLG